MIHNLDHLGGKPSGRTAPDNKRSAGRLLVEDVQTSWGELVNASSTGARIRLRRGVSPKVGDTGVLTIQTGDGPFKLVVRVAWVKGRNFGKSEAGVQFVEVSAEARLGLSRVAEYASRNVSLKGLSANGFDRVKD